MEDSFSDILKDYVKKMLPLLCAIGLILLMYIPIRFPLSKFLRPDTAMICVYFWTLYRRDLFGPISVAVLGIVADSLGAVPLGVNMFVFISVYVLAITFGIYVNTKPFAISWIGFALISLVAFLIKWLLMSVYYSNFLPLTGVLLGYVATVLLYPLVARLNVVIQNRFLATDEVIYEQR
ncbi:MAG: rod shape-determining protein MreD [Alphaproteobacteria bacterium]|nr:rod shape-determining protein MreD [Alphaproteobacteria bacterium]